MNPSDFQARFNQFASRYNPDKKDEVWAIQSGMVRDFLYGKVMADAGNPISDDECDRIIRILDRNGKGNTKDSQAVARAMIAQGAWRRMFNEFHTNKSLGQLILKIMETKSPAARALLIDDLYRVNKGKKNYLTGPSGNAVGAFLGAFDPVDNLSIIALNDRLSLINFLDLKLPFEWESATIGTRIAMTNDLILEGMRSLGANGTARTLSAFCYSPEFKDLWKGGDTVTRGDKSITVTVPVVEEDAPDTEISAVVEETDHLRESMQIQALLAEIGAKMGFQIWLPKADRGRVLTAWCPEPGQLVDDLPLGYDSATMKTIEQIDVLWLRKRSISRAFEVEHTTSVYSGLLRMADLVALQPDIEIKLHIVAPDLKRDKVMQEIARPVFSLLLKRPLSARCTYLSYENVKEVSEQKLLAYMSDAVLEEFEEYALDQEV